MAMQNKQKVSAAALQEMIAAKAGNVMVSVTPDPAYGWHATAMTAPAHAVETQHRVDEIARELRGQYDLDDGA